MILRDYQHNAKSSIKKAWHDGVRKQVIVMATGLGKTVVFCSVADDFMRAYGKKALILAHREELLTQARDKFLRINPNWKIGIEQGDSHADADCDAVVASVPTLGRFNSSRIGKFKPEDFCLTIVDEAHHASSSSYLNIFRHLGILKGDEGGDWNENMLLLGVTATPQRNDNQGIDKVFDRVVFKYDILDGIRNGFLAKIKAYRINTDTDLAQVKTTAGDFNVGDLGDAVNNDNRNSLVVKSYLDLLAGKQAICFCVNVEHTIAMTEEFNRRGVRATYVTGDTPKGEREARLAAFYNKEIQVMCNAMVLTEGYDNEFIEGVLLARPTQSGILYQQMVGRGTRTSEGKESLLLLDFVDNTYKQTLQTAASLIGIKQGVDLKGRDIIEAKEEIDQLLELAPNTDLTKVDINKIKYAIEEVDLLSGLKVPDEINVYTSYDWHRFSEGEYHLGLPDHRKIVVKETLTGQYELTDVFWDAETRKTTTTVVAQYPNLQRAIIASDSYVRANYETTINVIDSNAPWRKKEVTDKQMELLKKLGVNDAVLETLNKGDASRLITKLLNNKQRYQKPKLIW